MDELDDDYSLGCMGVVVVAVVVYFICGIFWQKSSLAYWRCIKGGGIHIIPPRTIIPLRGMQSICPSWDKSFFHPYLWYRHGRSFGSVHFAFHWKYPFLLSEAELPLRLTPRCYAGHEKSPKVAVLRAIWFLFRYGVRTGVNRKWCCHGCNSVAKISNLSSNAKVFSF